MDDKYGIADTIKEQERIARREEIVMLRKAGLSVRAIAREVGVARSTVEKWIARVRQCGLVSSRPRCGVRRATTAEQDAIILTLIRENPFYTPKDIIRLGGLGKTCCEGTVRSRLREMGLYKPVNYKKEEYSYSSIEDRVKFCDQYAGYSTDFWQKAIYADEITFFSTSIGSVHCWHQKDDKSRRSVDVSVNFFGWMWAGGPGELIRINNKRLTGDGFIEILEDVLLPTVRTMALPEPEPIFLVQNRYKLHKCEKIHRWFEAHPEISVLYLPAHSHDLNPIEDVWSDIVMHPWNCVGPRTPGALAKHCCMEWNKMRSRGVFFQGLVDRMPKRISVVRAMQSVIKMSDDETNSNSSFS